MSQTSAPDTAPAVDPNDPYAQPFGTVSDQVRRHAQEAPQRLAVIEGENRIDYAGLDALMDRVAASLQRDGIQPGEAVAACAGSSIEYAALFLGALRAGVVVAPLAPGSAPDSIGRMVDNAQARLLFTDSFAADTVGPAPTGEVVRIALDGSAVGRAFSDWLAPAGSQPTPVVLDYDAPFNIIYSSGTTGEPKGIVQSHGMRWAHVTRVGAFGYDANTVSLLSTPMYSNTTLVVFFPTIGRGGTVAFMRKFDAAQYLPLAQKLKATHAMLVPVQYQRLLARPDFDQHDLSSFRMKFCTSAPLAAELKRDIISRWPGGLVEFYGMTEGGGSCVLEAHLNPTKLHTVGKPALGSDIRLIDDNGQEVAPGEPGEVVGASNGMMLGYHRQPAKSREAEWFDATGKRFIRTGDIGRFDEDGFLILFDRKKDMVISGGFNVYPSDIEAKLREHPAVLEAAVVGVPSKEWGETPVAYVVYKAGPEAAAVDDAELMAWLNQRVGKTQRVSALHRLDELPRSAIGKILKRELRDRHIAAAQA